MLHVLDVAAHENIPVGFYGSTSDVLNSLVERMQARYEGLNVAFSVNPPFRKVTPEEDIQIVEEINRSGIRILFVGLGCPKQEIWMKEHRGRVNAVMLGVGAAFDFHAGIKPQAHAWMQGVGLEWLFRLWTEPGRLWKRYLYHNPRFVALAVADRLGPLGRRVLGFVVAVAAIVLFGMALPATIRYVAFMKVESSSYLKIRLDLLYSVYVVFAVAVIVRYLWAIVTIVRGEVPEEADITKASSGL